MRKRHLVTLGLLAAFTVSLLYAGWNANVLAAGKEATITGHVRDSYCLITMGVKGESHRDCAMACAKAGTVLMIQDEKGNLYVAVPEKDRANANEKLIDHAEQLVKVTGTVYQEGGSNFIKIAKVEAAK